MAQKILIGYSFLLVIVVQLAIGQGSSGSDAKIEPRYLIDLPTAGTLSHGGIALDMDFYQEGGLLSGLSLGVFDRLLVGVSYGGSNILGTAKPVWNATPGLSLKVRLIDETIFLPAIALGFDSQGREAYDEQFGRYAIKSLGFYAVASKNYRALGFLSLHGGVNYSLERGDGDSDPNLFVGAEKTAGSFVSLLGEYNLGLNDSNQDALGRGRGYFNIGFRASVGGGLTLGFNLKDIFKNQQDITVGNRTMKIEYVKSL